MGFLNSKSGLYIIVYILGRCHFPKQNIQNIFLETDFLFIF